MHTLHTTRTITTNYHTWIQLSSRSPSLTYHLHLHLHLSFHHHASPRYFPGSYASQSSTCSESLANVYFAGDVCKTLHGSWSQEKAFVTGVEAANQVLGKPLSEGVVPLPPAEPHVAAGRTAVKLLQKTLGERAPSLAGWWW